MNKTPETICIPLSEYEELISDQRILTALYDGGVNNWDWYGESLRDAGLLDDDEDPEEDE